VLEARTRLRFGPARLAAETGGRPGRSFASSPVSIRATNATTNRYEHDHPGDLVHEDVQKLGQIPDGGCWRLQGWTAANHHSRVDKSPVGFDSVSRPRRCKASPRGYSSVERVALRDRHALVALHH
jgi:hypothetical protein